MKVVFRTELYGALKDDVIAVDVGSCTLGIYQCHKLFDEYQLRTKTSLQQGTRNATPKEYLSLLTKLKNEGHEVSICNSLRKIKNNSPFQDETSK